jgi:hypothetical protein
LQTLLEGHAIRGPVAACLLDINSTNTRLDEGVGFGEVKLTANDRALLEPICRGLALPPSGSPPMIACVQWNW